ncbi:maltose/glucose-specific PTS transporter subunit IIBC [Bombilactobacillus folatiphilus]|uniref:Maltose/glucose-specific PTS transporter subunit IIBC n=1 Tax=Bombilactobacillus folatiphilus TaxID=2923362 RepID=A0ABY4P8F0_9LACO|nr:maltose/glucose-specific PTS transporter subunit IIBC [Bombilactobacillus folatiphilus]UQS81973.1 maltose/glucose-specific PTS transporter subunit IIBC [Bombilactobacillus folatiphilus]
MQDKREKVTAWEFFQGLGKTFMLPVSLLAFMGLFLGIGSAFSSPSMLKLLPFLKITPIHLIFQFMSTIGGFAFTYLPIMFAIAIPLGLAREEKGIAAFSGFVGYFVMNMSINFYLKVTHQLVSVSKMQAAGQSNTFGIQTIEMGVLGGIIVGLIVYVVHTHFYQTQLPDSFAFFSGTRFVPIMSSVVLALVGLVIPMIWPLFSTLINSLGWVIQKAGAFGPFIYGTCLRLLIPLGLHHILLAMIRFTQAGGTAVVAGHHVVGALNIFYQELQHGLPISHHATAFLSQGYMPTMMFGLPAVALAIYKTSFPENRKKVKGLLISGVIASFVTGITEPIEFLFLFISPALYVFHSVMSGLGYMVMALLNVGIGNTDGGILDWLIFGVLQGPSTRYWIVPIVGVVWFTIYYFVFKWAIQKYNLKTPGREKHATADDDDNGSQFDVPQILAGVGGAMNIVNVDNCVTRLRLIVQDTGKVNEEQLKAAGALGVMVLDKQNVQVVIGTQIATVRKQFDAVLKKQTITEGESTQTDGV